MNETAARKVAVRNLFRAYPSSNSADMATIDVYVAATAEFSIEAINRSVEQFVTGRVERENRAFAPSTDEFAGNVRQWHNAILTRAGQSGGPKLHNGLLNVDFGRGSIDMRGLTNDEQDKIMSLGGVAPNGESFAGMPLEHIKAALNQGDLAAVEGGKSFAMPKLGRMQ